MSETTWLFVIVSIAIIFPIVIVIVNNYFDNSEEVFDPNYDLPSTTWIDKLLDFLKINDFIDAMSSIPQPVRGIVWSVWIIMLLYILIKALPFT